MPVCILGHLNNDKVSNVDPRIFLPRPDLRERSEQISIFLALVFSSQTKRWTGFV